MCAIYTRQKMLRLHPALTVVSHGGQGPISLRQMLLPSLQDIGMSQLRRPRCQRALIAKPKPSAHSATPVQPAISEWRAARCVSARNSRSDEDRTTVKIRTRRRPIPLQEQHHGTLVLESMPRCRHTGANVMKKSIRICG
jgi:hypothetical protein